MAVEVGGLTRFVRDPDGHGELINYNKGENQ